MLIWIARNKTGDLWMFNNRPIQNKILGIWESSDPDKFFEGFPLPKDWFPQITWDSDPKTYILNYKRSKIGEKIDFVLETGNILWEIKNAKDVL